MEALKQSDSVLEIKGLKVEYGSTLALKGIDLSLERNKLHSIIGPSGCGKSTFVRCFNRMHELQNDIRVTGEILLNGANILVEDPFQVRLKMGMVFQRPNPFPSLSIYDNVLSGFLIHGVRPTRKESDAIVETALRKAALWDEVKDKLKKRSLYLSGGQQQRLCIARTIAVNPEVILMDEPTSALDPIASAKIEDLIDELRRNYAIAIVTHNMQQAARVSQRTAYFHLGDLVEVGSTNLVFTNPQQKLTEDYITGRFG